MQKLLHEMFLTMNLNRENSFMDHLFYVIVVHTYCCFCLCINVNKQQSIKTKPIVFTAVRISKEVSEVGQMVKASHETCDNCLRYGNKTDPPVGILPYPKKTTLLVLK